MLRLVPVVTLALLVGPILAGLAGTLLPAFGYMPAIGRDRFSLLAWQELLATPGLGRSVAASLLVGFGTTIVALGLAALLIAAAQGTRAFAFARRLLSPLLAVPSVAMAIGLAFTIAPSGLLFRLAASFLGAPDRPPDLLVIHDRLGLALMAGLVLKEVPFLFLMVLAALPQASAEQSLTVARSLGYGQVEAWFKVVLPRVYPQIRLPVLAVLAYGVSVVDVAIVLGPTTPPTLPVQILRWINDPDLALRFRASAAAILQLLLVLAAISAWLLAERVVARIGAAAIVSGHRGAGERAARLAAAAAGGVLLALVLLAFVSIGLWSVAESWRFPSPLPTRFTLANWQAEGGRAAGLVSNSLLIAALGTALAVVLVVGCLENEVRHRRQAPGRWLWLLYVPLLVPQIAFLMGIQVLLVQFGLDETLAAVVLAHLVFVLPYVFLSLADPWRAFDDRYRQVALSLSASPARVLLAVRLPMLLRAVLTAAAVGIAVSIGQYLATLLVAGARWPTITTEAVTLASGGDRRIVAVYAVLQALLPFVAFVIAIVVPGYVYRHRRALRTA